MSARVLPAVAAVVLLIGAGSCGGPRTGPDDTRSGTLARVADLRGASYVVAGGGTTELEVLCQLTIAAVRAAGAQAQDQCGKVGAADVRRSAQQTEVDTGWAYPGRGWRTARDLAVGEGSGAAEDAAAPFDALARTDAARGVTRLAPTAFSDVDALVVRSAGGTTPRSPADPTLRDATLCATPDAAADPVRLPAVRASYGLLGPVRAVDEAAVLAGVASGACGIGEVPGTSGRIPALGLVALDDDRGALTGDPSGRGGVSPVMRTEVFAARPAVAAVLAAVTSGLDAPAMRGMNAAVDQDGRSPRDAARRWLLAQGLIAPP